MVFQFLFMEKGRNCFPKTFSFENTFLSPNNKNLIFVSHGVQKVKSKDTESKKFPSNFSELIFNYKVIDTLSSRKCFLENKISHPYPRDHKTFIKLEAMRYAELSLKI